MYHYFFKNEILELAYVFILYTSDIDNTFMCCDNQSVYVFIVQTT